MKYLIMLLSLAALSLPAAAADQNSADELEIFTDNAENCIHFAGEWDVSLPADQKKISKKHWMKPVLRPKSSKKSCVKSTAMTRRCSQKLMNLTSASNIRRKKSPSGLHRKGFLI